jgi:3-deoxy-D-manno-octulosonic acid kinase
MHDAGISHPDLNLRNLLIVDPSAEVVVIDFDRARVFDGSAPASARARNLRRLARSARKLGITFDDLAWAALRSGYGGGWPIQAGGARPGRALASPPGSRNAP